MGPQTLHGHKAHLSQDEKAGRAQPGLDTPVSQLRPLLEQQMGRQQRAAVSDGSSPGKA